jgi:hypothetical protein
MVLRPERFSPTKNEFLLTNIFPGRLAFWGVGNKDQKRNNYLTPCEGKKTVNVLHCNENFVRNVSVSVLVSIFLGRRGAQDKEQSQKRKFCLLYFIHIYVTEYYTHNYTFAHST